MNWKFCPSCGHEDTLTAPTKTLTTCTRCHYEHFNNAKASVALAFVSGGQLLVSKRGRKSDPHYNMYDLPGGFVDFGETVREAAIREAQEETGIIIKASDLILLDIYHNNYAPDISTIDVAFLVTSWHGTPVASDDSAALEWKPLKFIYDPLFCETFYAGLDTTILAQLKQTADTVQ